MILILLYVIAIAVGIILRIRLARSRKIEVSNESRENMIADNIWRYIFLAFGVVLLVNSIFIIVMLILGAAPSETSQRILLALMEPERGRDMLGTSLPTPAHNWGEFVRNGRAITSVIIGLTLGSIITYTTLFINNRTKSR